MFAWKQGSVGLPGWFSIKNAPIVQEPEETRVRSPGREDPLEEGMATTPVFLPGESHGQRSLVCYGP